MAPERYSLVRHNSGIDAVNAAAVAAGGTKRPSLRIVPPADHTNLGSRRVWVRKRGTAHPTSVIIEQDELVDDFKTKVLQRFPTSLLRTCDPADLVLSVGEESKQLKSPGGAASTSSTASTTTSTTSANAPVARGRRNTGPSNQQPLQGAHDQLHATWQSPSVGSSPYLGPTTANTSSQPTTPGTPGPATPGKMELAPDEPIVAVIDRLFPQGMTVNDAIEVYAAEGTPALPSAPIAARPFKFRAAPPTGTATSASATPRPAASRVNSEQYGTLPSVPGTPATSTGTPVVPGAAVRSRSRSQSQSRGHLADVPRGQHSPKPHEKKDSGVLLLPRQHPVTNNNNLVAVADDPDQTVTPMEKSTFEVGAEQVRDEEAAAMTHFSPSQTPTSEKVMVPQINVLIVEDNVINQKILEAFMRRKNMYYAIANNGREAVSMWRQGGFHLILMDIQLPVMTGLEATKEIRRLEVVNRIGAFSHGQTNRQPKSPQDELRGNFKSPVIIVALTASSASKDKSEALAAGCNDFLTKPVNLLWLEQKIVEWGCMQALIDFDGWKKWIRRAQDTAPPGQAQAAA